MPRFPPPNDVVYIILDGKAVPVKSLPEDEWERCCKKMMENVGKSVSAYLAGEEWRIRQKKTPLYRKEGEAGL